MGKVKDNILKITLGILGLNTFTACYGIAPISYRDLRPLEVKGKVTDDAGNGIAGIKVARFGIEIARTASDGSYTATFQQFFEPVSDTIQVHFTDVDGQEGGGSFEPAVIPVKITGNSVSEGNDVTLHSK